MTGKHTSMARMVAMVCLVALTAFAGVAHANTGEWGGERCDKQHHHDFGKLAKKLGLTDAQKAQAKAIFQANRDVVKPMIANLRTERENLRGLIHADTIDEVAIRAETARIAGIQADLNVNRAKVSAQFRAILTPAQVAKLKALHQKQQKKEDSTAAPAE